MTPDPAIAGVAAAIGALSGSRDEAVLESEAGIGRGPPGLVTHTVTWVPTSTTRPVGIWK
jgi:hypothetical protein